MTAALKVLALQLPEKLDAPSSSSSSPSQSTSPPTHVAPPPASSRPDGQPPLIDIPPAEDPLLHYIASCLQQHGHRARATRTTSRMLMHIHTLTRSDPVPIVREAILRAAPAVKCLNHRQGSKNIAKPVALGEKQRVRMAFEWILESSKTRLNVHTLEERLAREMIAVLTGDSGVLKKKEAVHQFAMVNRGNAQWRT
ncbi:hypothetical protein HGRIS_013844 [Hohenbuehelia grisea]|uniref:Small ribosomal subunit protein uS7 domain-containing protein n=1 Tax=Hohenbuehelia grisea TaxID=104357 RepID=A0ABR3IWT6_9AGAR